MKPAGRAVTPQQKLAVVERILSAWLTRPHLRLGQLIEFARFTRGDMKDLFYVEDERLVAIVEAVAGRADE